MLPAISAIAALLVSVFVLLAGNGLLNTLVAVRANELGFGSFNLGLMGSAYFVGMTLGCLIVPPMIRRVGHIRTFTASTAASTAIALAYFLAPHPITWIILRAMTGLLFAVLYAVIESWLNDKATNDQRGSILGIYMIINFAGSGIGQQGMLISDETGFLLFALVAITVSLSAIPVSLTRSVSPPIPESASIRPIWLYHLSPVAFFACIAVGLVNSSFWTLAPVFITDIGYDSTVVANFMTVVVAGTVIAIWPVGFLSDRIDRRVVMLLMFGFSVVAGVGIALSAGMSLLWLYGAALLFGASAMPVYSIAIAHANDYANAGDAVEVATGVLLLYCFGAILGPLAASAAMTLLGPHGLFFYTAALQAVMLVWVAHRLMQRKAPPEEDRENYVALRPTSMAVAGLDPRVPPLDEDDSGEVDNNEGDGNEDSAEQGGQ